MEKFAIILTKDNNKKVISTHATKEEALAAGDENNKGLTKEAGVVSCIYGEFDDNNNLLNEKIQIYYVWI